MYKGTSAILIVLFLLTSGISQPVSELPDQNVSGLGQTDIYPNGNIKFIPQTPIFLSHSQNFYRKNFNANFQVGPDYTGISASLIQLRNNQLSLGFSIQMNQIVSTNQDIRDRYRALQPTGQYFFVPLLLNIKLHLYQNAEIHDFSPYLITGLGPAFGLYVPYGNFFNNLTTISSEIGGGGFIGAGVDYFWQEEWALSFDVRYNIFMFAQPLGDDQDYRGVSFFVGFSKALDY
jgi:hypothetical protein